MQNSCQPDTTKKITKKQSYDITTHEKKNCKNTGHLKNKKKQNKK